MSHLQYLPYLLFYLKCIAFGLMHIYDTLGEKKSVCNTQVNTSGRVHAHIQDKKGWSITGTGMSKTFA